MRVTGADDGEVCWEVHSTDKIKNNGKSSCLLTFKEEE